MRCDKNCALPYETGALGSASTKTGRTKLVIANRVDAACSLVSVSRAGGFDEACGFAALLAGIRIFDELK
jgi:hypothetical protein